MIPRAGSEHLISLRQHVDRAGGIGHDLLSQPVLEGRDHPIIAIVDDQEGIPRLIFLLDHHLPDELRPLNPERVVGRRATIAAAPAIFPSGAPNHQQQRERPGWLELRLDLGHSDPSSQGSLGEHFRFGSPNVGTSLRDAAADDP